jgi:hypothetical protein
VKVASDDTVKILDFGLAKTLEGEAASLDISTSPTLMPLGDDAWSFTWNRNIHGTRASERKASSVARH